MKLMTIAKTTLLATLLITAPGVSRAQNVPTLPLTPVQLSLAIHDYILAHPEVVLQSVRGFDTRNKEAEKQKVRDRVKAQQSELTLNSPYQESATNSLPLVTVVEFFDYRCGYCKKVEDVVVGLPKTPGVRIVYKDLPILGGESMLAAQAALAAEKQGGYAKLHHAMLSAQTSLDAETIDKLAQEAGLDLVRLKKDMASPEVSAAIARNEKLAETLQVRATPTFVVGDQLVSGALSPEALLAMIETARDKQPTRAAVNLSAPVGN